MPQIPSPGSTLPGLASAVLAVGCTTGSASCATELFNTFKIGKKGVDNGVLMLISKGDRRVEIETGYGMEERLPDARAGAIIRSALTPRFQQGDFDGGTLAGVGEVIVTLRSGLGHSSPTAGKRIASAPVWTSRSFWIPYRGIIIFLSLTAFYLFFQRLGLLPGDSFFLGVGGGDWGGGGGASVGSDSGGGESGGGGAGDSW